MPPRPAEGVFAGKCAELCGTYHSAMLFNVHIVSEDDYNAYLKIADRQGPGRRGQRSGAGQHPLRQVPRRSAMTTLQRTATADRDCDEPDASWAQIVWKWMITTDHKVIGNLYFITSFAFFLFGGLLAMVMRAELAWPGLQYHVVRDLQPVLHHARHDHAAAVRDAAVRRLRQRDHAAADRRARRARSRA